MANSNRTTRAQVTIVPIGSICIEGLMLPDGSFGVAAPQIAAIALDQGTPNYAAQTLKRICKKHSKAHIEWLSARTELNKNKTTYVTLADFQRVVRAADKAGHESANNLIDELMGLSLQQLFCDAFGVEFESRERQRFLSALQRSRRTRRQYTDVIKASLESLGLYGTDTGNQTFRRLTVQANLALFGVKHFHCDRNNMTEDQLVAIERFEGWVGQLASGYPDWSIEQVVTEALSRTPKAS